VCGLLGAVGKFKGLSYIPLQKDLTPARSTVSASIKTKQNKDPTKLLDMVCVSIVRMSGFTLFFHLLLTGSQSLSL
jgi:hypothetical protein